MKISKLYCNKPSIFEPIYFNIGLDAVKSETPDEYADLLNVILAEIIRHKDEKSDSHNLGKTTLSYLLDFMFLKEININTSRHFLHINENLFNDFVFYLEILLNSGEFLTIRRSVIDNTKIFFKKHNESCQNYTELSDEDWDVKGIAIQKARQLFDSYLNLSVIMPWGYRMGISYFLRTQQDYNDPFQISKFNNSDHIAWKPYIAQVLGFDGKIIREKYELDDQIEEKETEKKKKQRELSFNENEFIKLRSIIELEKDELDSIEKNLDSFSFKDEEKKINKELVDNIEGEISSINSRTFDISYDIKKIKNSLNEKFSFNTASISLSALNIFANVVSTYSRALTSAFFK